MNYTEEQKQIFEFVKSGTGHGIIDAVAGAGKTTTIMASAAHVSPGQRMLFCAFNKAIAGEIGAKFNQQGMQQVMTRTIHSLGWHLLNNFSTTGKKPELEEYKYNKLLKTDKMQERLEECYRHIITINRLDPDKTYDTHNQYSIKSLLYRVNERLVDINQKFRATLCEDTFEKFRILVMHFGIFNSIEAAKADFDQELEWYYEAHRLLLNEGNAMAKRSMITDFTDMLYLPYLWQLEPAHKYDFIFIDECQDLSQSQLVIALKHAKKTARILSVGDPQQSIYGFTGADIESFEKIRKITKARELPLTVCFRCPQQVVSLAKDIREDIKGSKSYPGIVKEIRPDEVVGLARPGDLIISRIKAPLVVLVFAFIDKNIKVHIPEEEARDFIQELRFLFNPKEREVSIQHSEAAFEMLKEQVVKRNEYKIRKNAERIVSPMERELIIEHEIAYLHKRLDFLHKKVVKWVTDCPTMEQIFHKIKAYISAPNDSIRLSSIHRAKGLEEDRVFIIDYPKLPYSHPEIKDWQIVQERNLKYVAITRAKEALYLVEEEDLEDKEQEGSLFDELF